MMMEKVSVRTRIVTILLMVVVILLASAASNGAWADSPLPTPASPVPTPTPPGGGGGNGGAPAWFEWLVENWELISGIISLILAVLASLWGRKETVRAYGIELMREAEELARKAILESGPERMEHVVGTLVEKLPVDVKTVLRLIAAIRGMTLEQLIREVAQKWFNKAVGSS